MLEVTSSSSEMVAVSVSEKPCECSCTGGSCLVSLPRSEDFLSLLFHFIHETGVLTCLGSSVSSPGQLQEEV